MKLHRLTLAGLLGGALWLAAPARAQDGSLDGLVQNSPFAAESGGAPGYYDGAAPLEFRGIMEADGKIMLGLFNPATGESFWVPANAAAAAHDMVVRSYDAGRERIELTFHGRPLALVLAADIVGVAAPLAGGDEGPPPLVAPADPGAAERLAGLDAAAPETAEPVAVQRAWRETQNESDAEEIAAGLRLLAGG